MTIFDQKQKKIHEHFRPKQKKIMNIFDQKDPKSS